MEQQKAALQKKVACTLDSEEKVLRGENNSTDEDNEIQ